MSRSAGNAHRLGRRAAVLASALGLVALTSLAPAAALVWPAPGTAAPAAGASRAATANAPVTVTGPHMYDPATKAPFTNPSTVTVSQTTSLVDQEITVSWTNFTPSNNQGTGTSGYNVNNTMYPVMVAECPATITTNPADLALCYGGNDGGVTNVNGAFGPTTEAYATTTATGTGTISIHIQTGVTNQALGCAQTTPCSLLVLPAQGGYPGSPGANKPANCANHKADGGNVNFNDYAAAFQTYHIPSAASGYDTCSWPSRIVVPLTFAATPANCGFTQAAFSVVGSPLMERAMISWQSALCHGSSPVDLSYDGTVSEPQARTLFASGGDDVALTTQPAAAGPTRFPFTYAPIGISAAAVAYWLDDQTTGQPYPSGIKLTPRLVTKLVTQSYGYGTACTQQNIGNPPPFPPGCDPAVLGDPQDILTDPEFLALNQGINVVDLGHPRAVPTVQSDNSDMTWEISRWIAADPGSVSFLAGQPDPFGDRVNADYIGTQYPAQQFTTKDPTGAAFFSFIPVSPPSRVALYQVENWWPGLDWTNPVIGPNGQPIPGAYHGFTVQPPGTRSLVAIMDLADATAYQFPVAALENHAGSYVTPTAASMTAAVNGMVTGADGITKDNNTASTDPAVYPLTMVAYAMVPTGGIPQAKAAKIAQWLTFVAGAGQTQGTIPGQLPPGYLPLPASMRQQTLKAAYAVLHQTGNHGSHGGGSGSGSSPSPSSSSSAGATHGSGTGKTPSTGPAAGSKANAAYSSPDSNAAARLLLPILLALGVLLALAGPGAVILSRPGARAWVISTWRRIQAGSGGKTP